MRAVPAKPENKKRKPHRRGKNARQSARLKDQPPEPFEPQFSEKNRCPFLNARQKIECPAHAHRQTYVRHPIGIIPDPDILRGRTECHEENPRSRSIDFPDDFFGIFRLRRSCKCSDDIQLQILFFQRLRRFARDTFPRPE
jgi:hypothetical protein